MSLNWPIIMVCAVGISILLTLLVMPQILHVSIAKRLFDRPNGRKIHNGIIPRLGGFAFLPVIILTLGLMLVIPSAYSLEIAILGSPDFIVSLPDIIVLISAMMIMFLTGLYDDLLGVKYWVKFLAQLLAAILLVEAGDYILNYNHLLGISETTVAMGKIISAFLIIYVVNALNLIDGIDGLAAGISVVALGYYGMILYMEHLFLFALLSWVAGASVAVFWVFNVFGSKKNHTKIFMGDIGSLSLGLFIAFMMIIVAKDGRGASAWGIQPMVLALCPLVIPLFDVIRVFCVRIMNGKSPFMPDKNHIHHLMLAAGLSMKAVMVVLIVLQVCIVVFDLFVSEVAGINLILIYDLIIYIIFVTVIAAVTKVSNKITTTKKYKRKIK